MFESNEFIEEIRKEDETMVKNIPLLKEINKHGFLTFDSQAGRCRKGKKSFFDGKPYEIKERSYIIGFMKKDKAEKFIKEIAINTDKNAMYVPICNETVDVPPVLDIPLTITIQKDKTEINTHTASAIPESYGAFLKKQLKLNKSEDVVYILCWDTKWCRSATDKNGLFTDVLNALLAL